MAKVFDSSKWDSQFYGTEDALKERPPTEYIVKGVLPRASLTIVYGAPGSGKTNIVIDLAICCALGKKWLEGDSFKGFDTERVPVLWIDMDCGISLLHERFGAALRAHGKNTSHRKSARIKYSSFLDPTFSANDAAAVNAIVEQAKKCNAGIIVFDNLGNISGGMDENTSAMIGIVGHLRYIAEKANAAVIVIHHVAKNMPEGAKRSSRGHGSIDASADNAFYIETDDNVLTITQTKARRHKLPEFGALFEYEQRANTSDLQEFYFIGVEPELPVVYVKAQKLLTQFFKTHNTANQITLLELLMQNKISKHKARGIIQVFTRNNFLRVKAGQAHNQLMYQLYKADAKISLL